MLCFNIKNNILLSLCLNTIHLILRSYKLKTLRKENEIRNEGPQHEENREIRDKKKNVRLHFSYRSS